MHAEVDERGWGVILARDQRMDPAAGGRTNESRFTIERTGPIPGHTPVGPGMADWVRTEYGRNRVW